MLQDQGQSKGQGVDVIVSLVSLQVKGGTSHSASAERSNLWSQCGPEGST